MHSICSRVRLQQGPAGMPALLSVQVLADAVTEQAATAAVRASFGWARLGKQSAGRHFVRIMRQREQGGWTTRCRWQALEAGPGTSTIEPGGHMVWAID